MPGYACQRLSSSPNLLSLSERFPGKFPYLLESAALGPLGSHSLLLYAGEEILVLLPGGELSGPGAGTSFFERLESWYQREHCLNDPGAAEEAFELPFIGGWFIYLGYEAVAEIEQILRLPENTSGLPDAIAHRCRAAIIISHGKGGDAVAVAESESELSEMLAFLDQVDNGEQEQGPGLSGKLARIDEEDPKRFIDSVNRILEYLVAGDVFQVNVSRRWNGEFESIIDPSALYKTLRTNNPAPFSGLLRWKDRILLSSSPERLVQINGDRIQTRPIAGTRPRGADLERDQALSKELIDNLKERAEHIMLIDLERNDLGRVCKPGSVEVNELMVVETYAHVHHIVSNVRGELKSGASPVDAIRAVFPGGTITGCPKVRCMQIIAELEREGRGYYTGSMGYLGRNGQLDLNILIRSLLLNGRNFSFRTGAGIVADSVPENEVAETRDKARGMLLALQSLSVENDNA